jgi:hypothetical protein
MLHVPGGAATAPAVWYQHRPIRLVFRVVGGLVKVGGLAAVGELHPEAEELIGERVTSEGSAVQQVRELLLLSGGTLRKRRQRVNPNPAG